MCIPCIISSHGWAYVWFYSPIRAEHFKAPVEGHRTFFILSNRIPGISLTVAISDLCVAACNNNEKHPWQSRDATSRADAQEGRLPAGERRGGACGPEAEAKGDESGESDDSDDSDADADDMDTAAA